MSIETQQKGKYQCRYNWRPDTLISYSAATIYRTSIKKYVNISMNGKTKFNTDTSQVAISHHMYLAEEMMKNAIPGYQKQLDIY